MKENKKNTVCSCLFLISLSNPIYWFPKVSYGFHKAETLLRDLQVLSSSTGLGDYDWPRDGFLTQQVDQAARQIHVLGKITHTKGISVCAMSVDLLHCFGIVQARDKAPIFQQTCTNYVALHTSSKRCASLKQMHAHNKPSTRDLTTLSIQIILQQTEAGRP